MFTTKSRAVQFVLVVLLLTIVPARFGQQPEGDIRQVHDPSIIKEGDTYYLYSTRAGLAIRCSKDLVHWRLCGDVFAHLPEWAVREVPGLRGLWAPDVAYFNGKYHLYYSVSTFGSNHSCIGLATNQTLDPSSEKYRWMDQGKVIGSNVGDDWNAIDPDVVLDERDQPWLAFGSFWGGIKLRKLDEATGKLSAQDQTLYSLASRPRTLGTPATPGAIEAPNIIRKNDYYYLFVSFDFCCRGKDSTYNIRVGRARRVTGPYIDRTGKPMMEGGRHLRPGRRRPVGWARAQCGFTGKGWRQAHLSRLRYRVARCPNTADCKSSVGLGRLAHDL